MFCYLNKFGLTGAASGRQGGRGGQTEMIGSAAKYSGRARLGCGGRVLLVLGFDARIKVFVLHGIDSPYRFLVLPKSLAPAAEDDGLLIIIVCCLSAGRVAGGGGRGGASVHVVVVDGSGRVALNVAPLAPVFAFTAPGIALVGRRRARVGWDGRFGRRDAHVPHTFPDDLPDCLEERVAKLGRTEREKEICILFFSR